MLDALHQKTMLSMLSKYTFINHHINYNNFLLFNFREDKEPNYYNYDQDDQDIYDSVESSEKIYDCIVRPVKVLFLSEI